MMKYNLSVKPKRDKTVPRYAQPKEITPLPNIDNKEIKQISKQKTKEVQDRDSFVEQFLAK